MPSSVPSKAAPKKVHFILLVFIQTTNKINRMIRREVLKTQAKTHLPREEEESKYLHSYKT
jgi:hypothetical protein